MQPDHDGRTQTRSECGEIDVYQRAHAALQQAVARTGTPHRRLTTQLAVLMAGLLESPMDETEMRLVADTLDSAIDDRFHPVTDEMERDAAHRESAADRREDAISDLRLIDGDTPERELEHAKSLDETSVSSRRYARVLRHKASRAIARVRLGLTPRGIAS